MSDSRDQPARRWSVLTALVALLGLGVSAYLLTRTLAVIEGTEGDALDVCSAVFGRGCDPLLGDPEGLRLGLPWAGWGIVYFGSLLGLLAIGTGIGRTFRADAAAGVAIGAAAGCGVSAVLLVALFTGRPPACPLCLVTHGLNLALLGFAMAAAGGVRAVLARLRAAARWFREPSADARTPPWKALAFVTVALLAVALYQWGLIETRQAQAGAPFDLGAVIEAYEAEAVREIPLGPEDARLGRADAPVTLVVFTSFQCGACRTLAGELPVLHMGFEDDLTIVLKHFPLGTACNPLVPVDVHPQACAAAGAAEAARRQERFWAFHDALFAGDLACDAPDLERAATAAGLDLARFRADREDAAAAGRIRADAELGIRLGVDATPAVFLQGRRVPDARRRALEALIRRVLRNGRR